MSASAGREAASEAGREPPLSMRQKVVALARRPDVWSMASVVLIKAGMVVLNFALILLAARALGAAEFGYYSILFSAGSLLLVVAAAGQELFVIRSWSEFEAASDTRRLKGALTFSFSLTLACCLAVSAGLLPWAQWSFDLDTAIAVTAFVALAALLQVTAHLARAIMGVAVGDGIGHSLMMLPPIAYVAVALAMGADSTIAGIFFFLAAGAGAGIVVHAVLVSRVVARRFPGFFSVRGIVDRATWLRRSGRLWLVNSLEALNQYADVLIIGFLLSPAAAGAYFILVRLSNLLGAAADAINLYATRHFPSLYYRGQQRELATFLDGVAWITLAFIVLGVGAIASAGYFVLLVINPDYTRYMPELLVLCLGTAALAVARPCSLILMLTGHEGRYLKILTGTVALRAVGLFGLIPYFGVMGAVMASAVASFVAALLLRSATKTRTGLDPSLARLWSKRRDDAYAGAAE